MIAGEPTESPDSGVLIRRARWDDAPGLSIVMDALGDRSLAEQIKMRLGWRGFRRRCLYPE